MKKIWSCVVIVLSFITQYASAQNAARCNIPIVADCNLITAQGGLANGTDFIFCDSATVDFTNTSTGTIDSTYYCWGDGTDTAVVGTASASHRYILPPTAGCSQSYTIRMTVIRRCFGGTLRSVHYIETPIIVRRKPRTSFTATAVGCVGNAITFTNTTSCPSADFLWTFGNGRSDSTNVNPVVTFDSAGTYNVRLITRGACQGTADTAFRVVTVYNKPVATAATATTSSANGCGPLTITFQNNSQNYSTSSWTRVSGPTNWAFVTGSSRTSTNPTMIFRDTGTYRMRLTVTSANCGSATWDTLIRVLVGPTVSLATVNNACNSLTVRPSQIVTYTNGTPTTYNWTFTNTTPGSSSVRLPADITYGPGSYSISLTASNVCGTSTSSTNFVVTPAPSGNFSTVINPNTNCIPASVQFQSNVSNASAYDWQIISAGDFQYQGGTTRSSANPNILFTSPDSFTVRLTAIGCASIVRDTILAFRTRPTVLLDSIPTACLPVTVSPTNIVRYSGGTPTSFYWTFAGSSRPTDNVRQPAPVTYQNPGIYTITTSANNICGTGYDTTTFRVDSLPDVNATVLPNQSLYCAPATIAFNSEQKYVYSIQWVVTGGRFRYLAGTSATSANPLIEFLDEGTYTVKLIGNGCVQDEWTKTIQVLGTPVVNLANVANACQTTVVDPASIVTYSGGTPSNYRWTFTGRTPDSSNLRTPSPLTYGPGNYTIIARASNVCAAGADTVSFVVTPAPVAAATVTAGNPNGCVPIDFNLNNASRNASQYTWTVVNSTNFSFVNGSTQNSPNATIRFTQQGTYQIRLTAVGCSTAQWDTTITLIAPPTVDLAAVANGCQSLTVNPGALVQYGGGRATSYLWTFTGRNPDSATVSNPTSLTYGPGNYTIIARARNVCATATDTVYFSVVPAPVLNPLVTPGNPNGCVPVDINLQSRTQNASQYTWTIVNSTNFSFINGTNRNSANAVVRFNEEGTYQIRLNVVGCSAAQWDTTITLIAPPTVDLTPIANGCQTLTVNPSSLVRYSGGVPTSYLWTFTGRNPDSSNLSNPSALTYGPGNYTIIARARNICATGADTINFTVVPAPVLNPLVTPGNPNGCVPVDINLQSRTQNASQYTWTIVNSTNFSFINGTNRNSANAVVRFNEEGTYQIRLNVVGCSAAQWDTTITLIAPPIVDLAPIPNGCQSLTVNPGSLVQYRGGAATSYLWTFTGQNPDSSVASNPGNLTYGPGSYRIIARARNVCAIATDTINFTVTASPVIRAVALLGNPNGCVPVDINFESRTSDASQYTWSVINSNNYTFVGGTNANSQNTTLRFTQQGTYQVRLNVVGCSAAQWDTTIRLITFPTVALAAVPTNCAPQTIFPSSIVSYSGGEPTQYNWTFTGGNIASSTERAPGGVIFNNLGLNRISITTSNVCGSATDSKDFILRGGPEPNALMSLSDTNSCNPLEVSFNTANARFVDAFRWTAVGATFMNGTDANSPNPVLRYNRAGTYNIRLNVEGCGAAQWDTAVTVVIPPSVSLTPVVDTCGSMTVNPADIANFGGGLPTQYTWTFSNTSVPNSSMRTPPSVVYNQVGQYAISVEARNKCGISTDTIRFRIKANPVIRLTAQPLLCNTDSVRTLQVSPSGGTWSGSGVSSTGVFNPNTANLGINKLYYLIGSGQCASRDSLEVEVSGANVRVGPDVRVCQNERPIMLTGASPTGIWSGPGIIDSINGVFDPSRVTIGVQRVTYTVTNLQSGCVNRAERQITVFPAPRASFDSVGIGCKGTAIFFANTSTGIDGAVWNFGDNATTNLLSPTHIYDTTGIFNVWLKVNTRNGCVDSTMRPVEISQPGTAAFVPDATIGCGPLLPISFANNSRGQNLTYLWDFGNGQRFNTPNPPTILFRQSNYDTSYVVRLTVTNSCGASTHTDTIRVRPRPTANFGIQPRNDCSPMVVDFSNASLGYPTSFYWDFGNGRTSRDSALLPQTYRTDSTARTFYVTLIVGNVCGFDTLTQPLRVLPPEVKAFFTLDANSGCAPFTVNCRNFSTVGSQVWWDSGNGVTSFSTSVFTHTYNTPGFYTITLYAANANGCGFDSIQRRIEVLPAAEVGFVHPPSVCVGDTIAMRDTSRGFIFRIWQFGDNDSSRLLNAVHVYRAPGNYTISMIGNTLNGNCAVVRNSQVYVRPLPTADLIPDRTDGCPPLTVSFQNASTGGAVYAAWDFGDGNTTNVTSPVHRFDSSGNYSIRLRVTDNFGCADDTLFNRIAVHPVPTADFDIRPEQPCGLPSRVQFVNRSNGAVAYQWDLGNGLTSSNNNPTTSYGTANVFPIQLIATNTFFCTDTIQKTYQTYVKPTADFTVSPQSGCSPLLVRFEDMSSNVTGKRLWLFGDGSVDSIRNPVHLYEQAGLYSPTLIVSNNSVCFDTLTLPNTVRVLQTPVADFEARDSIGQRPTGVIIFTNNSQFAQSYQWNFGDNSGLSTLTNPVHRYLQAGPKAVQLIAKAANGCLDSIVKPVEPKFFSGLFVPNAFSPESDADGIRFFKPQGLMLKTYKLAIYSTYGDLIWSTDKLEQGKPIDGWDGTRNGVPLPQDVYVWKIQATFEDGSIWLGMPDGKGNFYTTGTLTLLR